MNLRYEVLLIFSFIPKNKSRMAHKRNKAAASSLINSSNSDEKEINSEVSTCQCRRSFLPKFVQVN